MSAPSVQPIVAGVSSADNGASSMFGSEDDDRNALLVIVFV